MALGVPSSSREGQSTPSEDKVGMGVVVAAPGAAVVVGAKVPVAKEPLLLWWLFEVEKEFSMPGVEVEGTPLKEPSVFPCMLPVVLKRRSVDPAATYKSLLKISLVFMGALKLYTRPTAAGTNWRR